jgi:hypothetical protein
MNREDIIRMAREAGFDVNFDIWSVSVDGVHINKELHCFATLVAAAEREECAKYLEGISSAFDMKAYADAIRARGQD